MTRPSERGRAPRGGYLATLALAALGIVYGDIGTSPLYAIRESFYGTHGIAVTPANVLGVLSPVEGLEIATPEFASFVIPVTLVILIGLFFLQSRGTARIGAMFGPVMC